MSEKKEATITPIGAKRAEKADKKLTQPKDSGRALEEFTRKLKKLPKKRLVEQVVAHAQMAGQERQKALQVSNNYKTLWGVALRNEEALTCANNAGFEWCRGCQHNPEGEGALGTFYGADNEHCKECNRRDEPPLPNNWTAPVRAEEPTPEEEEEEEGEA